MPTRTPPEDATVRRQPTQQRGRVTIDGLLDAARGLLDKPDVSWRTFSTNAIARLAQVSVGALYHYFQDKESLLCALAERHIEEDGALYRERIAELRSVPIQQAVPGMVRFNLALYAQGGQVRHSLFGLLGTRSNPAFMRRVLKPFVSALAAELERRRDELSPQLNPNLAARLLVSACDQVAWLHTAKPLPDADDDAVVAELSKLFVAYLR